MRDLKYSKFNLITVSLIAVGLIGLGPLSCDLAPRDQRCDDGLTAESAGELAGELAGEVAGADLCADLSEEGGDEVDQTNSSRRWSVSAHPCVGNRTDALHCDDALTCYVGCGTTTNGRGVYITTDGGETWGPVITEPAGVLDQARINDISRAPGGDLYFAGELSNGARVVALDAAGNLREVFTRGTTVDLSFTVGSFRQTPSGRAIAESLTGSGLVYRGQISDEPTASWTSGAGFWSDGDPDDIPDGVQLLALETYGEDFYGVGSTISAPNTVFLPKWEPGTASLDFQILQFNQSGLGAFTGALWDIDVSADWIVVGGVNQSAGTGMIYTNRRAAELTDPATWHEFDVADVLPERSTWITGVCLGADAIYAVGRESRAGWGFVLRSTDGGVSFVDISPPEAERLPDVSRCMVRDGELLIAGAQGLFARYHSL